jgi:periplasmic protein TonB
VIVRKDLLAAFAVASGLHVLAFAFMQPPGGDGGGENGTEALSLSAASPQIRSLVQTWDRRPETATDITATTSPAVTPKPIDRQSFNDVAPVQSRSPLVQTETDFLPQQLALAPAPMPRRPDTASSPAPTAPTHESSRPTSGPARPDMAMPPLEAPLPYADTNPPPRDRAPLLAERPRRRPDTNDSEAVARRVAFGDGGSTSAGQAQQPKPAQASAAAHRAAQSLWAAQIQRRIARHQIFPRGAGKDGRVRVSMVVLASGKLGQVAVENSSGLSALDQAAVRAVQRAAPFPPAPKELSDDWFRIGQWITFERR